MDYPIIAVKKNAKKIGRSEKKLWENLERTLTEIK